MAMTVVVAYDISEDRRRSRVAATLQTCGDRVQRSVFVYLLDADQLTDLLARVTDMIDTTRTPCTRSGSAPPAGRLSEW
jgi:CRISPR-associated protein Cas2